jgi:hypothetical protein
MAGVDSLEDSIPRGNHERGSNSWIDELPFPAWTGDTKGRSLFLNAELRRLIGCQEPEVSPTELAEKIHPDDRVRWLNRLSEVHLAGAATESNIEYRIYHFSGD